MATLRALDHASPVADAEALRKACQGWGTDEKAVISILGRRNTVQRQLIRKSYEEIYQEDLLKRLESELSGDFERAVYRWILEPADRDAVFINVAIKQADHSVIIEMSTIHSPEEFLDIKRAYQARYKHSLEEDLAAHTNGDDRKFLVALASTYRYNGGEINARLTDSEAGILHDAIKDKNFNHEEIIRIITTRSKSQLMATFNRYKDEYGISITKHLADDKNEGYLRILRTVVRCICDPHKYYEKVLRNAINKPGTDEDALTRVIVTRAEKDLKEIKEIYFKRNSVSLDHSVAKESSGYYKAFLLTLLGKED